MVKCVKCTKLVSKKNPGIQCSKCSKWSHAACVSLSAERLNIYAAEEVEWKCHTCVAGTKNKRVSVILPEAEEENNTDNEQGQTPMDSNDRQLFLKEIRREIREFMQEELKRTLQFYSDKIDDYEETVEVFKEKVKLIENQNKDLNNKYSNMKLKCDLMEQKINTMEQSQLENLLEINGIETNEENLEKIVQKVSEKLEQNAKDIIKVYKKVNKAPSAKKRNESTLVVTLRDGCRDQWLQSSKSKTLTPQDIGLGGERKIYMREALTPATAFLLWKTKTELKGEDRFKFVWCKRGTVLIRKSENEKTYVIRSVNDIEKWLAQLTNV